MTKFCLNALETTVNLNFLNFDGAPYSSSLALASRHKKGDMEVFLYEDHSGTVIKKAEKAKLENSIKRTGPGSSHLEIFNITKRRTFCFFRDGISLAYIISQAVSRSFLVFQTVLDIIFLHAASIVMGNRVYLFVAPSGGGKSTISSLAIESDLGVLDDEFCVIKRKDNRFYAGLFPFNRLLDVPPDRVHEVGGVFFLNKSDVNKAGDLSATEAISRAFPEATCFFRKHVPGDGKADHKKQVFNFLDSMFESVDYKLLDFKKSPDIFSYLKCHVQDKI